MTFSRANPIGWAQYELLTAAQMNTLDTNVSRALDGYAGGYYAPSSSLEIAGAGVASGPALKVRAAASGAALHLLQSSTQLGLSVVGSSGVALANAPATAASIIGTSNSVGPGGDSLSSRGGNGGSGGYGGPGVVGYGGNATASGNYGGIGVQGLGGIPYDNLLLDYSGAGIAGIGSQPIVSARRGGPGGYFRGGQGASGGYGGVGLVAQGGTQGSAGKGGAGIVGRGYGATGYFDLTLGGDGVIGIGGTNGFGGFGVVGIGGSGAIGGYGVYGIGRGTNAGGYFEGGSTTAIQSDGCILFSGATGQKNPSATDGQSNKLWAKNVIKAWGIVRNGVLIDGYNIASVAIDSGASYILEVTLATAMNSTDYAVITGPTYGFAGNNPRWYGANPPGSTAGALDARTTTFFEIVQVGEASTISTFVNFADSELYFLVLGAQ